MPTDRHDRLLYELVGQRIRERRVGRLSQECLGDLVSLSRTSITNLEKGRQRVPLHQLMRIADALGCELSELMPPMADLHLGGTAEEPEIEVVGRLTPAIKAVLSRYTPRGDR